MATITVTVGTGTQYQIGGSGNVYFFNGSQPTSFTFPWVDTVLRLDQSGSSNDGHPLFFSTSNSVTLSLVKAGIISSGVTYYLDGASNQSDYTNTTTFNAATTRYIEITPTAATADFYYACWVHGISMGGIIDITQDTWGALSWGNGNWNAQNNIDLSLTGFSITASLGDLAYSAATDGWGRQAWGDNDWGTDSLSIIPTGLSMTGSIGSLVAASEQGWGRAGWGEEPWGDSYDPVVDVTGFAITASLGTLEYSQSIDGWGRDSWGDNNWGEDTTTVILSGLEMTGHMGLTGWGRDAWSTGPWGEETILTIGIGHALTGLEATGSVGAPQINYDYKNILDESLLGTLSLGALSINNGADHTQGVAGKLITGSVGSLTVSDVVFGPIGFSITGIVGTPAAGTVQTVNLQGSGLTGTMSLGSLGSLPDMLVGSGSFAISGSLGSITPPDQVIGLSGFEMSGTLGSAGMSPLHYKDVDITGYTAYTDITSTG